MRILTGLVLALALLASVSMAQVPRGVLAEDGTATWCVYCPFAYAGLEVMKTRYDATEFNAARYYSSSQGGQLFTTETNSRNTYYAVSGFPTVIFDGTAKVVGGSSETSTGSQYDPLVISDMAKPSPLKITINSVDLAEPDGSIDFTVEVAETMSDIGNVKIRGLILENNITNPYNGENLVDVTRDVLPDTALVVSQLGQVQHCVWSFTLPANSVWKTADLWMALFIQDDDDKSIVQSASTRPAPAYSLRYWAKGSRVSVVPASSGLYEFQDFAVFAWGTSPDVIHVSLSPGTLPAGWSCSFSDGTNEYTDYADVSLAAGEGKTFRLRVNVGDAGYAAPKLTLSTGNLPGKTREIAYTVITDDVQVLLVDDDGAQTYEASHTDALQNAGYTFGIWPTGLADVTGAALSNFAIVDWEVGLAYPTLSATDRAALTSYLNGGGKLFLSGQDIGWEMDDTGGAALTWYQNTLHTNFVIDDTNINTVTGVTGDPIGNGMSLSLTPALNIYPDALAARDAYAIPCFTYNATYKAAMRVDTGVYKVVYLGFGYEAITTQANKRLLMQRVLDWFGATSSAPEELSADSRLTVSAFPNPALGTASLRYDLPAAGRARLEIYGLDGSLVRTLLDGEQEAGPHVLRWDGRDNGGSAVASGVYFYRLRNGSDSPSGKLILTRR